MVVHLVLCSGAGASASSSDGGGLGFSDWAILAFMAGAAVIALLSVGLTLIAVRRLAPVPASIPIWPTSNQEPWRA